MAHGISPGPQHVFLDGGLHTLLPLASLETAAFVRPGVEVTYPSVSPGWATATVEGKRCCAWFEGAYDERRAAEVTQ